MPSAHAQGGCVFSFHLLELFLGKGPSGRKPCAVQSSSANTTPGKGLWSCPQKIWNLRVASPQPCPPCDVLRWFSWWGTSCFWDVLQQLKEADSVSLFVFWVQLAYQAWVTSTRTVLRKQRCQEKEEQEADPAESTSSPGETIFPSPAFRTLVAMGCPAEHGPLVSPALPLAGEETKEEAPPGQLPDEKCSQEEEEEEETSPGSWNACTFGPIGQGFSTSAILRCGNVHSTAPILQPFLHWSLSERHGLGANLSFTLEQFPENQM